MDAETLIVSRPLHLLEASGASGQRQGRVVELTMGFRFNGTDQELLTSIAEHRLLSVFQLAILHQRNADGLRRRLRLLREHGLVAFSSRGFGVGQGRPENLVSLTESSVDWLKAKGVIPAKVPCDRATATKINCPEHELLINDFRVQLAQMQRAVSAITTSFFSPTSPLLPRVSRDKPLVRERIRADSGPDACIEFVPDGVFAMTHEELRKTLLFFLEVDMGTEPLTRRRGSAENVRQKILNYQDYFQRGRYKRYEKILTCQLRGFRLLILADCPTHLATLSRLVREMPPSDFIWLTDRERMMSAGIGAPIWARGGKDTEPFESILGSKMPEPCPTPHDLT